MAYDFKEAIELIGAAARDRFGWIQEHQAAARLLLQELVQLSAGYAHLRLRISKHSDDEVLVYFDDGGAAQAGGAVQVGIRYIKTGFNIFPDPHNPSAKKPLTQILCEYNPLTRQLEPAGETRPLMALVVEAALRYLSRPNSESGEGESQNS